MPPHLEGCIWDGFISRSMPRVRHGVAGLTWAGVGIPGQGRRLTSTCRRPPPTSALDWLWLTSSGRQRHNPRRVLALLPHAAEHLKVWGSQALASPHGRGPASLPGEVVPPG